MKPTLIFVSIDDMNRFEQKEMKKIKAIQNSWYDWLTNYTLNPIRKTVGSFKDKIVSLFKTKTPENYNRQTVYGRGKKPSEVQIQKKKNLKKTT